MGALVPMSRSDIIKRLKELGAEGPFVKAGRKRGKHKEFMMRGKDTLHLPNDHGSVISVDLLTRLLNQWHISRVEWLGEETDDTAKS